MFQVVSISLGSPHRDFDVEVSAAGERFRLRRRGTGGSLRRALELIEQADGTVDAIGLGGVNKSYRLPNGSWPCREGVILSNAAKKTPVVDGGGFKGTFERELPGKMATEGFSCEGKRALVLSVLDRWGLALGLERARARVYAGDALSALDVPVLLPGMRLFGVVAGCTMWALSRIPLESLYPLAGEQDTRKPGFPWLTNAMDIFAGDFHFARRVLPDRAPGKWVITTSTTVQDREWLKSLGVSLIVTTSPVYDGRSLGANVLDAMAVAYYGGGRELSDGEYSEVWEQFSIRPSITRL